MPIIMAGGNGDDEKKEIMPTTAKEEAEQLTHSLPPTHFAFISFFHSNSYSPTFVQISCY